ncbi:ASCC2 family CUE domain-containing protein [Aspergillus clavatus NRRL 1]|uniref:CUE domain protein, putative n=1 Tax=Aspergillus clavatus (strain ATCC 1007 / CBS 513.65 / DSM 816 / NCTC 3887 / NRRL 1 / QM 1276 / 107) TaxID=344612 RepID=A1CFC1_ASPCL|nr:CUE domain protein, putative [Aspergillus clavatus NRRL 1]EAW11570.1 CUE domain protein, putative [Aspergillus clavatus NRRL 1]
MMEGLPPLAPVPPPAVQKSIPREDWESCLDAWILLLGIRIEASDADFRDSVCKDESTIIFLSSFYQQLATSGVPGLQTGCGVRTLRKLCFLLTRRLVLDAPTPPPDVLEWSFLAAMCCCYPSSSALKRLLSDAWSRHHETITSGLERAKSSIIKRLAISGSSDNSGVISDIRLLTILISALPSCGQILMAGSDFLDTLSDAYRSEKREDFRKVLVANVYVGLTSLLKGPQPNLSLLLDQLFSLKASAGVGTSTTRKEPTILSDLICSSDLLARLDRYLSANPQKRGQDLVASLRAYQNESRAFHHRYQKPRNKTDKGKDRAQGLPAPGEIHVHRMSLVTQVQDLFPDLGSGYIVRLLDHYGDNPETVVAHLLDASLPPELQELDHTEQLPASHTTVPHDPFPPRPTPPEIPSPPEPAPVRKNIFDEDVDLAELARSSDQAGHGQLRFGRAGHDLTADAILADRSQHAVNKAAIMSALATFDSDDDERDDTYDVADVGGTVDGVTAATDAEADADIRIRKPDDLDMTLFQAYRDNAALFARDSATRRSQPRASLKRDTGMTDEAIEGWAVMLTRDPKRLARLEDRFAMSASGPGGALAQPDLPPTAYRKPGPREDGESDSDGLGGRGGGGRGRGRGGRRGGGGGGRGRRGGAAAGASGDQNNPVARQRKEENKASRANHNRRQQRAKKMARGGGMPG